MSDITYSREYLRGIPEQVKRQQKQNAMFMLCSAITRPVTKAASAGKTSHLVEENSYIQYNNPANYGVAITNDEILSALSEKFPDCVVSFQETWVDTSHNTRVLKKGILIDWS
jgi:hypothetical protein